METTMDYEEVLHHIGDFGKYQKRLLLVVIFPVLFASFSSPISVFLNGDQKHRCKIPDLPNDTFAIQNSHHPFLINTTIPMLEEESYDPCHIMVNGSKTTCDVWVFDFSVFTNTINSQFNLVCESKLSSSHAVATYFMGLMTSPFILTPLGDIIGRRLVTCISLTVLSVVRLAIPFSSTVTLFAVFRFLDGVFIGSLYTAAFTIGIELLNAQKRMIAGTVTSIAYCGGEFVLVCLAYFIRDWRWLQLVVAIPTVIPLIYWWPRVLPESVRWLISKDRMEEALVILRLVAKTNKKPLPENLHLKKDHEKISIIKILKQLFTSRKLLMYFGITSANWFVILFIFHGIKLNIGNLGGNLYLSFTLVVIAETLGSVLMFAMDKVGHKRLHMIAMGVSCISCIASIFPILLFDISLQWMTIMFSLIGMVSVFTSYGMIIIYTGEIFPTVVRQFTSGSGFFFGGIGSICSPYLYHMADGKLKNILPLILYSVIITAVTLLTIFLPETNKRKLPDNIKDSEEK